MRCDGTVVDVCPYSTKFVTMYKEKSSLYFKLNKMRYIKGISFLYIIPDWKFETIEWKLGDVDIQVL